MEKSQTEKQTINLLKGLYLSNILEEEDQYKLYTLIMEMERGNITHQNLSYSDYNFIMESLEQLNILI